MIDTLATALAAAPGPSLAYMTIFVCGSVFLIALGVAGFMLLDMMGGDDAGSGES